MEAICERIKVVIHWITPMMREWYLEQLEACVADKATKLVIREIYYHVWRNTELNQIMNECKKLTHVYFFWIMCVKLTDDAVLDHSWLLYLVMLVFGHIHWACSKKLAWSNAVLEHVLNMIIENIFIFFS